MIRGSGIFGSVREALELGAAIERSGHEFVFYTSELDEKVRWLPNSRHLVYRHTAMAENDTLDAIVFSDNMRNIGDLVAAKCEKKVVCIMGFDPETTDQTFGGDLKRVLSPYPIIADSPWQLAILRKYFDRIGPAIGGVNTDLFKPVNVDKKFDVVWSGDHRERKGGDTVQEAIKGMNSNHYFKKGIRQEGMSAFLCSGRVFVDGHRRGGWCNPVMEAMSCGIPVVCTDTPCNSDFAHDGINCIKVPMNDGAGMREAVLSLLKDEDRRSELGKHGRDTAQKWTHDHAAKNLVQWLQNW